MTRAIVFLSLGAGAFGALLGCWIALSQSPVVTTVLPLLFAFAGGAGGAFLWRNDPNTQETQRKIELFGAAGAAFSLCCLGAMILMIYNRASIVSWLTAKADTVDVAGYADPLGALIYRDKLMLLGASNNDIKTILGKPFPDGWKTNAELLDNFIIATTSGEAAKDDDKSKVKIKLLPKDKATPWQMSQPDAPKTIWPLADFYSPHTFDWQTKKDE
jgi:hypothetical protein